MAFKLRSVNTKFWEDPFIEDLKPEEKLLFLYFLTNPLTNLIGIYEISIKRISYDTGLTSERVSKALKVFERGEKVFYIENYIVLPNFVKNQSFNSNMKKGALNNYNDLPNWLKDKLYGNALESFESLSNALKIEYKEEYKEEDKGKCENVSKSDNHITQYKQWLSETDNGKYKSFINWILSENLNQCLTLDDQINEGKFIKILSKHTPEQIKLKISAMENKKDLLKKYNSFYRTLLTWLKND